jgi:acyl-CoA thioesterase-1
MRLLLCVALVSNLLCCKSGSASAASRGYVKPAKPAKGLTPAPLISRGKPVSASKRGSNADRLTDGKYKAGVWEAGRPTADKPSWVAIDVGVGPEKLFMSWTASGSFNHNETTYGGPGSYRVEVSADSTDGEDGTWKTASTVSGNEYRTRAHGIDFAGNRWLRLVITGPTKTTYEYGVQLDELDIHDISGAADDTWFFIGDSITAFAFDRAPPHQPSFAELISKKHPGYFPALLNGGNGFEKSSEGLKRLPTLLKEHPEIHFWALGFGTNDAAGDSTETAGFEQNLDAMVKLVKAAGRVPLIARIPYAPKEHDGIPKFNAAIDAIAKKNGLMPGPDLYAHFKAHPEELSDGLHPNDAGIVSINRLWAAAVDGLY